MDYEEQARQFCEAIKVIASQPEKLDNLEHHLSHHFKSWMEKWASTPDGLVSELRGFANMD